MWSNNKKFVVKERQSFVFVSKEKNVNKKLLTLGKTAKGRWEMTTRYVFLY